MANVSRDTLTASHDDTEQRTTNFLQHEAIEVNVGIERNIRFFILRTTLNEYDQLLHLSKPREVNDIVCF